MPTLVSTILSGLRTLAVWTAVVTVTLLFSAAAGGPAFATTGTFVNPVVQGDTSLQANIYFKDGYYYNVQHVGIAGQPESPWNQVAILKSPTLEGLAYSPEAKVIYDPGIAYDRKAWVPALTYLNGNWYIYDCWLDSSGNRRLHVLRANTQDPLGTWTYLGQLPAVSNWAYDPNVLQKSDGSLYLVYAANPVGADAYPAHLYIAPMSNPSTVSGSAVLLAKAQYSQPTDPSPNPALAWEGQLNEAPAFLIKNGKINLVYNGNSNSSVNYAWGLLTNTDGNVMNPASWTKKTTPVFAIGATPHPPGNHFFTKSPDGTEDWAVYGTANSTALQWGSVHAQKFTWNGDNTPNFGTPVGFTTPQARPSGQADLGLPYQLFYNAEYQAVTNGVIQKRMPTNLNPGPMGFEAVRGLSAGTAKVHFTHVKTPMAGNYPMAIRYALKSASAATQPVKVNGAAIASQSLPPTSATTDGVYGAKVVWIALNAGANTVEFGPNGGVVELDGFQLSVQQASFAALAGGASVVSRSNAMNGKTVGTMTSGSSCMSDWRLWALGSSYTMMIRYSAPTAASITVSINGAAPATVALPSTGSANTFSAVTTGIGVSPMKWNFVTICRAAGSPEIDAYAWY